jgi:hypothetical protein
LFTFDIKQVGSLEDVLKTMEVVKFAFWLLFISWEVNLDSDNSLSPMLQTSERGSGWDDLIFIPPGKRHSQHIKEIKA